MAEILDYYRSKRTDSQYVFPILLKNDLTPTQIADRKQKVLLRYNRQLKEIAALARQHNNANIISIPARFTSIQQAIEMVDTFLNTNFEGGRHATRVDKISCS